MVGSNSRDSYEGIKFQVAACRCDPHARAILLDIESPGGEAVGAFEPPRRSRGCDAEAVTAWSNAWPPRLAYALACRAPSQIITRRRGLVGSIGVVMLHLDHSSLLDKKGITRR